MSKRKILYTITGIAWTITILFSFYNRRFPDLLYSNPELIGYPTLALSCISMIAFLLNREKNKEISAGKDVSKKIISAIGILLSATITLFAAGYLMLIIWGATGNSVS